jgi:hypothetical protein
MNALDIESQARDDDTLVFEQGFKEGLPFIKRLGQFLQIQPNVKGRNGWAAGI